jgi:hypothetical protein
MFNFIRQLCAIHEQANCKNRTACTGDKGTFNYLAGTKYNKHIIDGAPVKRAFKKHETKRNDCWFRHK